MAKQQSLNYTVHRYFGVHFNQKVWKLLSKPNISVEEGYELIDLAHASNHHWREAGTALNQQRGAYLIARVFLAVGNPYTAIIYAKRCLAITETQPEGIQDFDYAYAQEMMWKCELAEGNIKVAEQYKLEAQRLGDLIKGKEDKKIFDTDFKTKYVNITR